MQRMFINWEDSSLKTLLSSNLNIKIKDLTISGIQARILDFQTISLMKCKVTGEDLEVVLQEKVKNTQYRPQQEHQQKLGTGKQ